MKGTRKDCTINSYRRYTRKIFQDKDIQATRFNVDQATTIRVFYILDFLGSFRFFVDP